MSITDENAYLMTKPIHKRITDSSEYFYQLLSLLAFFLLAFFCRPIWSTGFEGEALALYDIGLKRKISTSALERNANYSTLNLANIRPIDS